ncbi:rhodanese-like domain-containing protein [candidate division CSSED10-310 bacterium]|uniref:Rhodanese-like domain-containing protein n=1 Tax=candidate division CSSED10-310 bacterium TaxID=2855610 RepID=A0ABV6YRL9_UNCC1
MPLQKIFIQSVLIVIAVTGWAFTYNFLSPGGIPLLAKEGDYRIKPKTDRLDLLTAKEKFDLGQSIFIDSRSPGAYDQGHIPGAISMPYYRLEEFLPDFLNDYAPDLEFITYCDGSDCDSSVIVANQLKSIGYETVYIFFGGWNEWFEAGYPVE